MSREQLDERAIFGIARRLDAPQARDEYLQQVCGDNLPLADHVRELLRAAETSESFLEMPAVGVAATIDLGPVSERPGTRIGPYKLLEQIGEGGMGVVYVAEQREPISRKVALKIIKPGMDTRAVVARFEAERQALALMDHPNIAKVFDAGATEAGRPYFVMELVKGNPITEYCDREQLSTRERLELFVALCHGVQHAHQKGVIHRDLKPSNVLVEVHDVRPVPKIIDFGVAKAMGQHLTELTLHTGFDQMVGTPLYMSPEQAGLSSVDVDTRSDIYSLGVLLYELLTGHTPFEKDTLQTAGVDELRRIIREVDPPRPSARVSTLVAAELSTIADRHRVEPGKLSQQLRGELDWIVMKAMDKDRNRRYETANALAADVERYLHDQPVEACPPSRMYRVGKFARRNRTLLIGATTVLLSLFAVSVSIVLVSLSQRRLADQQRELADRRLQVQRGINDAVTQVARLRGEFSTDKQDGDSALTQAREQAQRALALAETGQADQALVAQVRELAAQLDREQRERQLLAALDKAWLAKANMVDIWFNQHACLPLLQEALKAYGVESENTPPAECAAVIKASTPLVQAELVSALYEWHALTAPLKGITSRRVAGKLVVASVLPNSVAARDGRVKAGDQLVGVSTNNDAPLVETSSMAVAEVKKLLGNASGPIVRVQVLRQGETEPQVYEILRDPVLAWLKAILDTADQDAWRRQLRDVDNVEDVANRRAALEKLADEASVDRQPVRVLARLALQLRDVDAQDAAIRLLRRVWQSHPDDVDVTLQLAELLWTLEPPQLEEAVRYYTAAVALRPDSYGLRINLGNQLKDQQKWEEAIGQYRAALAIQPDLAIAHSNLGRALTKQGKLQEAVEHCREALRISPDLAGAHVNLGVAIERQGKLEEAITEFQEAVRLEPSEARWHSNLGGVYSNLGRLDEAIAECREALRIEPDNARIHFDLATLYGHQGQVAEMAAEYREVLRIEPDNAGMHDSLAWLLATVAQPPLRQPEQAVSHALRAVELAPQQGNFWGTLGRAHYRNGQWKEAIAALRKVDELGGGSGVWDWLCLAMAHWQLGEKEEARRWYAKSDQWFSEKKPDYYLLLRFRDEAAELLGVQETEEEKKAAQELKTESDAEIKPLKDPDQTP